MITSANVTNLSLPTGISNLTSMGTYMNTATGGFWFWTLILLAFYVTLFIIAQRISTTARAAATSGFVSAILGIMMYALAWISFKMLFITIIATVFGVVALYLEGRQQY